MGAKRPTILTFVEELILTNSDAHFMLKYNTLHEKAYIYQEVQMCVETVETFVEATLNWLSPPECVG